MIKILKSFAGSNPVTYSTAQVAQLAEALDNDSGNLDIREFLYALADRQGLPL